MTKIGFLGKNPKSINMWIKIQKSSRWTDLLILFQFIKQQKLNYKLMKINTYEIKQKRT